MPIPRKAGHYWAKLIDPAPELMAVDETAVDWMTNEWEPVEVFFNNGEGDERYRVFILGRSGSQRIGAFEWGPRISHSMQH